MFEVRETKNASGSSEAIERYIFFLRKTKADELPAFVRKYSFSV